MVGGKMCIYADYVIRKEYKTVKEFKKESER